MSDSQLYDLMAQYNIAAMTAMTLYLTAVSGYLVVAYSVGVKLTKYQVGLITGLFVWFTLFTVYGTVGYFTRVNDFSLMLEVQPVGVRSSILAAWVIAGFELIGILGCLKFMRDTRQ